MERLEKVLLSWEDATLVEYGVRGYIDGFVQERRNSIANALELRLSCTNLSICLVDRHCTSIAIPWMTRMEENGWKSDGHKHCFHENWH